MTFSRCTTSITEKASLILENTFVTLSLFTENINADVFYTWMTQDLLPKLPHGAVIVMDNAPFHKRNDTTQAIADSRCQLEWLPAYSPDLTQMGRSKSDKEAKKMFS
ncbi:transposase [Xenorhabdus ishibashii]|uniref:transposase n=1 Tax=Xenorhabdus ishibashii TaxID=1034471 RepID=UPI00313453A4